MNLLKKTWFRAIISLFAGGMTQEIIHVSTGNPNRPTTTNLSLVYAVVIYFIITYIANKYKKNSI